MVDSGGQRQVEETVCLRSTRQRHDVSIEFAEGTLVTILPTNVRVPAEER